MELIDAGLFLAFVAFGAFVQTITGFAMGLMIMGGVTVLHVAPISLSAAVVSFVSLVNTVTALRRGVRHIDHPRYTWICLGMIPALVAGVFLLGFLSETSYTLARRILGFVILMAGAMLLARPQPWSHPSPPWLVWLTGSFGGITGGLFSTAGPPIAFLMYRQPVEVMVIRATLLAVFATSTMSRILVITVLGQVTPVMLALSAAAIPVVLISTAAAQRAIPYLSDLHVRRSVFTLLIAVGGYLVVNP